MPNSTISCTRLPTAYANAVFLHTEINVVYILNVQGCTAQIAAVKYGVQVYFEELEDAMPPYPGHQIKHHDYLHLFIDLV